MVVLRGGWIPSQRREGPLFCGVPPDKQLSQEGTEAIDSSVFRGSMAEANKDLMELVEGRIGKRNQESIKRPVESPTCAGPANSVKNGRTEGAELDDMGNLSNAEVKMAQKIGRGVGKKPAKYRENNPAGLFHSEVVRGKDRDGEANENGRNPKAKALLKSAKP